MEIVLAGLVIDLTVHHITDWGLLDAILNDIGERTYELGRNPLELQLPSVWPVSLFVLHELVLALSDLFYQADCEGENRSHSNLRVNCYVSVELVHYLLWYYQA